MRPEEVLYTPVKVFNPLWQTKSRYKGAWGGRGSAKSWDRAAHLILRMYEKHVRAICLREVQKSIKDSVKQLLEDTVERLGLGAYFDIVETEIRCTRTGSTCGFMGMKDQNAESIKSTEGVEIFWWEEAQTASDNSLQILRPTVRSRDAELWFTWNPRHRHDAVDRFLRQQPPEDAVVVKANWSDNPHFPEGLDGERQHDLATLDAEMYAHVWEGDYLPASSMQFISSTLVAAAMKRDAAHFPGDERVMGVDLAWGGADETVICRRVGRDARTHPWTFLRMDDTMQLAAKVAEAWHEWKPDALFVDNGGAGKGVIDRLRMIQVPVIAVDSSSAPTGGLVDLKVANLRAEMWTKMRQALQDGLALPQDDKLQVQLTDLEYGFNTRNEIQLESKDKLRRENRPSPDRADALALTYAYPVMTRALREAMPGLTHAHPVTRDPSRGSNPYEWR